ncbi:MAG: penicillin acylase family protein [Microthrixaceae bacterium]|nr:penicillin acylase family protein [Microthrixaceae bacterium]
MTTAVCRLRRAVAAATAIVMMTAGCTDDSAKDSATTTAKTVTADSDTYRAEIRRTTDGVAHITAAELPSVIFGQGWASGEDHTCTLADQILKVTSTRAKWLGPGDADANLNSDFAWKSLRLMEQADKEWADADDQVRELITAFTDGWNAQFKKVGPDGVAGWCAGAEWLRPIEPVELFAYSKSIALAASGAQLAKYLGVAQPPTGDATPTTAKPAAFRSGQTDERPMLGSNAWAFGEDRSADGGGMLMANPHFPWEGGLRFWEVHLTVPGEMNVYGAMLTGLPAVGIGFNEHIAWSHTVSAGSRFTAYKLSLAQGDPTAYVKDGKTVPMQREDVTVEVAGAEPVSRTLWWSEYGPILNFPGVGWSTETTLTYRDANIDNDELLGQYLEMDRATSLKEFQKAHEEHQGVPLFNTIATSADGKAWYADTSATPNLSPEAEAAFKERLKTDPLTKTAFAARAVLLDGSTSRDDWVEVDGARDPGLVPYSEMPQLTRDDYVFNANDSFWLANPEELLDGEYSILHGEQGTERSRRTRENLAVLADTTASGPAGDDAKFSIDELAAAALRNGGFMARELRDEVVERCETISAEAVGTPCRVLAEWDGLYNVDSKGAALFREFLSKFVDNAIWAEQFDPARPLETPRGLVEAPTDGSPDPVLDALEDASKTLTDAGFDPAVALGEIQVDGRGSFLPVPGGTNLDGVTNIVGWSKGLYDGAKAEGAPAPAEQLNSLTGLTSKGYWVNNGTSFLMVVGFDKDGPQARTILTYGETSDRTSPLFTSQVERFAKKDWKKAAFTEKEVEAEAVGDPYEVTAPR